jgi:hypothetical protein
VQNLVTIIPEFFHIVSVVSSFPNQISQPQQNLRFVVVIPHGQSSF